MKYKTVKIFPNALRDKLEWRVMFMKGDLDRVETKAVPNALGFFHYPETMPDEDAFEKLKVCMIEAHEKEIKQLKESVDKLKTLDKSSFL